MVAEAQPPASERVLGLDSRTVILTAIGGLLLLAYWGLVGFDPNRHYEGAPQGAEGTMFAPSGSSPTLIFLVFLLLLYSRIGLMREALGRTGALGPAIALIAASAAVARWAVYTAAGDLLIPSLILMLLGAGLLLGGRQGLRAIWVPAIFLIFAYPLPATLVNQLVWPLQLITAKCASLVLSVLALDPIRFGDMIFLEKEAFHVIETCSGMRMIQTMTMAGALYAILFYRSNRQAALLIVFAPFAGFLVNWVRVLSIIFNPYSEWGSVHTIQGIVMLVVGVLMIAAFDTLLQKRLPDGEPKRRIREPRVETTWPRPAALAVVLLALAGANALLPRWEGERPPTPPAFGLPSVIAGSPAKGLPLDDQFLGSVGATRWIHREYDVDGIPVRLQILANDRLDRRGSVLSGKTAIPGGGWELAVEGSRSLGNGVAVERSSYIGRGKRRALVYHWNEGVGSTGVEILRNALALDRSPMRRDEWALAIQITTPILDRGMPATVEADRRLEKFTLALRDALASR